MKKIILGIIMTGAATAVLGNTNAAPDSIMLRKPTPAVRQPVPPAHPMLLTGTPKTYPPPKELHIPRQYSVAELTLGALVLAGGLAARACPTR